MSERYGENMAIQRRVLLLGELLLLIDFKPVASIYYILT